jgi:hypothetical protein
MRTAIFLLTFMALTGCETKEHAEAELGAIKKAQDAAAKATTRANASGEEEIGIPECDAYIRKYQACLAERVPVEAQTPLRIALDEKRKQWRASATDQYSHATVSDQCRSAMAIARQSMSEYGCDF